MAHLPGSPDEKRSLLSVLDEQQFPYLVADFLVLAKGHRNVRVVDGPGDGRRDIHSQTADGAPFLTQCKFHRDVSAVVGSRETDELAFALLKFGSKQGLFVTTARLSPQAKREYLDNFPGYSLHFMDGAMLVTEALAVPAIHSAWLSADGVRRTAAVIALPFTIRCLEQDAPRAIASAPGKLAGHPAHLCRLAVGNDALAPYRTFTAAYTPDLRGVQVFVFLESQVHEILNTLEVIRKDIATTAINVSETRAIRFGRPLLVHPAGDTYGVGPTVQDCAPATEIVSANGASVSERDYVVPRHSAWLFPRRVTTLSRHYCHWYNEADDCLLSIDITSPPSESESLTTALAAALLDESLAIQGRPDCIERLLAELLQDQQPTYVVPHDTGAIACWLHPRSTGPVVLKVLDDSGKSAPDEDDPIGSWIEQTDGEFRLLKEAILSRAAGLGLASLSWASARHHLALAGVLPEIEKYTTIQSSELLYFIERFPSPLDLRTRTCTFLQILETASDIDDVNLNQFRATIGPGIAAGCCEDGDRRHLGISLTVRPAVSVPMRDLLEVDWEEVRGRLRTTRNSATEAFERPRLVTRSYWETAYAILFP
jgi:hypothetical protein